MSLRENKTLHLSWVTWFLSTTIGYLGHHSWATQDDQLKNDPAIDLLNFNPHLQLLGQDQNEIIWLV